MATDVSSDRAARRAAIAARALELRRAIGRTVRGGPAVAAAAARLSAAYRSGEPPPAGGHLHDASTADAYAAARMPATYAAIARALAETADRTSGFAPTDLLDVGAGTGASAWAASAVWPSLRTLTLVDREPATIELGRRLAAGQPGPLAGVTWRTIAIDAAAELPQADVVIAAYLLGEVADAARIATVERLWAATRSLLVLVEPGSRAGFARIRTARADLIEAGGHAIAPCPGNEACPVAPTDPAWCHFLARLDRSPLQRTAKAAERSWEDEPYSYVAASRAPATPAPRVVLGRPRHRPGLVELRVCVDGRIETRTFSRRDGPAWRVARDLAWGDPVPRTMIHRD